MRIRVLGAVRGVVDGRPVPLGGPKQRLVLAHLVLRANSVVPTDRLVDAVWNGSAGSRSSLHTYISHLRKALGPDRIETEGQGQAYRLRVQPDEIDALRFEQLATRGHELVAVDATQAVVLLSEALTLWQGPPFADLDGEPSLRTAAERLEELRLLAVEDRMAAHLATGGGAQLVGELEALTTEQPLRERLWELRMLALYRAGRQAEALAVYTQARDMLADELGIDPSPDLQLLHGRVLRQDPELRPVGRLVPGHAAAVAELPPPANPYKGLLAFTEQDSERFFGREALTTRLVERLADGCRFLVVVGPSGSGKSSLVRAGLLPALCAGAIAGSADWHIVTLAPAPAPAAALRCGLGEAPPDGEILLVIDQLEEVFTPAVPEPERSQFLAALAAAVAGPTRRARAVVTLRADFYDRPLADPVLAELVRTGTEAVVPLSPAELQRAIAGPARQVGVEVEPELVAHVVGDVTDQPGALPLLQYSLTEVFDRRPDGVLDVGTYRTVGGVSGALARRAEDLYGSLSSTGRDATRQLFLRLVTPGEGVGDTRRRVARGELASAVPAAADLVDVYGAARLLSFDLDPGSGTPTVEVAHEALLREWHRLRGWIDAARDDLRIQRRVALTAAEWAASGRDDSYLASGSRLAELETWRADTPLALTSEEEEFLRASLRARDEQIAAERARAARERDLEKRSLRRLRALVAVLAGAALVASGLTVYAVGQGRRARAEALTTRARELAAAADANLSTDAERAILLALEAVATTRDVDGRVLPEAEAALHRAVSGSRALLSVPDIGGSAAWSPARDLFVTEGPEDSGVVDLRRADSGTSVRFWHGHDIDVNDVAFDAGGGWVATTGDDGALRVWDAETGALVAAHEASEPQEVWGPSFSPDGALVAGWWSGAGEVRVVEMPAGRVTATFPTTWSKRTAFSPDGTQLAITTEDGVTVIDLAAGSVALELTHAYVHGMAWSPDGRWIATGNAGGLPTAKIWDARDGSIHDTLHGHRGWVFDVAWSPDGTRLATGGHDRAARVWELSEDGAVEVLQLRSDRVSSAVYGIAFSPDGGRLLASDMEIGGVTIFDVEPSGDGEWAVLSADHGGSSPVAFMSERTLVTGSRPGEIVGWDPVAGVERWSFDHALDQAWEVEVNLDAGVGAARGDHAVMAWDLRTGERLFSRRLPGNTDGLAVGPGGEVIVSLWEGGGVTVFDREGTEVWSLPPDPPWHFYRVALDARGRRLAAIQRSPGDGVERSRTRVWDVQTRDVLVEVEGGDFDVALDAAGEQLAVGGRTGARVFDVRTGGPVRDLRDHNALSVAFSPDGRLLATGDFDGTVRLFELSTGSERLSAVRHQELVEDLAFSPDGGKLASASADGAIRVWALDLDDLISLARTKVSRALTDSECRRFLHASACPN